MSATYSYVLPSIIKYLFDFQEHISAYPASWVAFDEGTMTLTCHYDVALSVGDKTALDALVDSYGFPSSYTMVVKRETIMSSLVTFSTTTYRSLCAFNLTYDANAFLHSVQIIASVGSGATYDLRIYDMTNRLVLGTITGQSNETDTVVEIGSLSNVPTSDAIIEIHGRISLTNKIGIMKNVQFTYAQII